MRAYDPHAEPAVEIAEIRDFLRAHAPFDALPAPLLRRAAQHLEIAYFRKGSVLLPLGEQAHHLVIVRSGAVELHDAEETLVARLGEGEYAGYPSLLTEAPAARRVRAYEDTLVYLLPAADFHALRAGAEAFDAFFNRAHAERIRDAVAQPRADASLAVPLRRLVQRAPISTTPDCSVQAAAQQMTQSRVSSLLVEDGGRLVGILTDRDLRARVLAAGLTPDTPVRDVMTTDPLTIQARAQAAEALLAMSRRNIHHLPVLDGDALAGVVTTTDLMRLQAASPVYLVGDVWKQTTVAGLQAVSERLPALLIRLVDADARADDIGRVVTALSDAIGRRLLELAEAELGPPPVPYAWLVLGSQARQEQTAHSDQDHALLLHDDVRDAHDAYFEALARFVSDGLDACGYVYCPGDVMATNPTWRQPLRVWRRTFRRWIEEPSPKALMHASIFFDLRPLHGTTHLAEALLAEVRAACQGNTIFLASLSVNALQHRPPLGFFRQFVVEPHGEHDKTLDMKHQGVVPAVDLARIYALASGIGAVNTHERLAALQDAHGLAASDAQNLADAHEFIAYVRLQHQGRQLRAGQPADNYVAPDRLSPFERRHLKDAFRIIRELQAGLASRYQTHLIS